MDLLKMPGVTYCEFKKGESLIHQGEEVNYIYYLISGKCYRMCTTDKGDEVIYGVKESNDFVKSLVGVLILYGKENRISSSEFIARNKCCCYRIPQKTFFAYVENKPEILTQLLHIAMSEYQELYNSFQARQEGKVANRLCALLLKHAQLNGGRLLVNKTFSNNAEISRFLGIHKVTVAKILKALKEKGILDKDKDGIIIYDEKQMKVYAEAREVMEY